jgi:hypothetical protein
LAVLLPIAVIIAFAVTRPIIARINRRKRIAALEQDNERLDSLLSSQQEKDASSPFRKKY